MDFVKREDQNVIDDENYKLYLENLQKSHQIEQPDYQHTHISMEQLHQAMQSSLNTNIQNFSLPLSPRQMSTLMLRTNLTRNELPAHLRNIELDLAHSLEIQNLRHEDLLAQNLNRNLDLSLRNLGNDLDLQAGLTQSLLQNMTDELRVNEMHMAHNLRNDMAHNLRNDMAHDLSHEIDLSEQINRQHVQELIEHERRTPMVIQCVPDTHIIDQIRIDQIGHRIDQSGHRLVQAGQRLDQTVQRLDQTGQRLDQTGQRLDQTGQRLDQTGQRLDQTGPRLDQIGQRLDQRFVNDRLQNDHEVMPMQFHIKCEQEDEYFYDNINSHGISNGVDGINGHITQEPIQQVQTDQIYSIYPPQASLNPIDLYTRSQFPQNLSNPQNLVMHRQYEVPEKKIKDGDLRPKENLNPNNKVEQKDDLSINIKGEYVCYKCNEIFPSKRGLKQHSKSCTDQENGEKVGKFGCSQCAYRCQSPAILKIHERTHSGEKPFSCNFCDYKSGQKNNVAKHILVHMKEKPFRCQYCDYRCAQKNNLVVHERTHTGFKPFACNICNYRTVQKPNLVKHMYLHTNQKPFSCDICNYRCVQKTNLTKHKQRHLNENSKLVVKDEVKPYRPRQKSVKCPHCSYKCVQKASMEKHLKFQHSDLDVQNLSVKDTSDEKTEAN